MDKSRERVLPASQEGIFHKMDHEHVERVEQVVGIGRGTRQTFK